MSLENSVPVISKILGLNPMKTLRTSKYIVDMYVQEKFILKCRKKMNGATMIWKPLWKPLNLSFDSFWKKFKEFGHNHFFVSLLQNVLENGLVLKRSFALALAKITYRSSFSTLFNYKEAPSLVEERKFFFKERIIFYLVWPVKYIVSSCEHVFH